MPLNAHMFASIFVKRRDVHFIRYVLASIGALAVDVSSFLAFLGLA